MVGNMYVSGKGAVMPSNSIRSVTRSVIRIGLGVGCSVVVF